MEDVMLVGMLALFAAYILNDFVERIKAIQSVWGVLLLLYLAASVSYGYVILCNMVYP